MARVLPPAVVLVTGATSGIGRALALALARDGYRVLATGRRLDLLRALKAEAGPAPLETLRLDVTSPASVAEARDDVLRLTGGHGVDVLVNNAGYGQFGPIELATEEALALQYQTNVLGLVRVTAAFLPQMRERGAGRIVNVSSIAGRVAMPFMGLYHGTKYAVEGISDALRREVAGFGVQVVLIEPGAIKTGFKERSDSTLADSGVAGTPYFKAAARFQAVAGAYQDRAPNADRVVRLIRRVLRARSPRARYMVPAIERLSVLAAKLFPTWLVDAVSRWALGLTRRQLRANLPR
jgi:NAD(P)-dependent dehydrogenase (short-subunit alcohol dehydrogenase family)